MRITPATVTWSGAVDDIWTRAANWVGDTAPTTGDDLVFPGGASRLTVTNDFVAGTTFGSISINADGYDLTGNAVTLGGLLSAGFASSSSSLDLDVALDASGLSLTGGASLNIAGTLSGTGGITISGGGSLTLGGTNPNTFTGTTTVSAGTLSLNKTAGQTALGGALTIGGSGTVSLAASDQLADGGVIAMASGAYLNLNNFDDTIGGLNLTGSTVATGTGTLTLNGNVTTNSDSATSVISGKLDLGGATRTFTVANNAQLDPDLSITADISGTGAGLIKAGSNSQLKLSGNSTYDGTTTITAGAIEVASDNALGSASAGTVVNAGFSVALLGGITMPEPFTISGVGFGGLGSIFNGNGNNTITGAITLATATTLGSLSGTLTFGGAISDGASSFAITKVQSGTVAFAGANTYDGGTTISGGVIAISNGSALGTGSVSISNGAELDLSNDITLSRNISFRGTGVGGNGALRSVSGNNTYSGTATVQATNTKIKVDAGQLTLSGDLTDGGNNYGVDKYGAGVLTISGSFATSPILHAVEGDLRITGSDSSIVTLYGGTISGTGTVGALDHAGNSFGTVDPGTGGGTTGTLTTSGGYQVGTTGTTHFDIGGTTAGTTYDQIVNSTSGSVDLTGSTIDVSLVGGFIPAVGDVFTVIDKQNSGAITGTFNNLAEGDTFQSGIVTYQVTYAGGNGNDVDLEVVAVTYTWTGLGGDGNWSTAANWDANQAPADGEDLVFPSGASRLSNNNDMSGKSLRSIEFGGSGYFITGNGITVTDGITYTYSSGTSTFAPNITLTATETIDVAGGGTLDLSGKITVNNFGGGYGVTKTGAGTLKYSGSTANDYNGTTTINAGTLLLAKPDDVIAANGSVIVGDNTVGASLEVAGNNQFWVGADVTVNEGSTFDVGTFLEHISNLNLQGSTVQIDTGGALYTFVGVNSTATTNNQTSSIGGLGVLVIDNTSNTFTIDDDPSVAVDLRISTAVQGANSSSGFTKYGTGTLALAGGNTYGGGTTISGGAIQVESDTALGTTDGDTTVDSGASVYFSGAGLNVAEDFNIDGTGVGGDNLFQVVSGGATLTGSVTMTGSSQIGAASGSTLTLNGVIGDGSSAHDFTIANGATGRTVLGGANTYAGITYVTSGYARLTNDDSLGASPGPGIYVQSGATLELAGGITLPATKAIDIGGLPVADASKIISVSGNNTIAGNLTISGGNNESFDVAGGTTLTVSGAISGSRDFDKNNTGTLILSGTSGHTGNVNVGDGTLIVDGSLATSNSVFVDGVLRGSGTTPAVTISSIGTLSPGNSPGILNTGNLAFSDSGSTYVVELDGTTVGTQYDQANVTGSVNLAGATLSLSLGFSPATGDVFTIINNDGSDAVSGSFNGLPEGSTITVGGRGFRISYVGGSNSNDVTLTANARIDTWTGANSNSMSDPLNWAGNITPVAGDQLVFPVGAANITINNDFAANTRFDSFVFGAPDYSISGNAVMLDHGIQATYSSGTVTLDLDTTLLNDQTFDVASGGTLDISGAILFDSALNGRSITKGGGGTLKYSGSASNNYNGGTTVNAGTIILAKTGGATASNGSMIVGDNTVAATLELQGDNQFWAGSNVTVNEGSTFDVGTHQEFISVLSLQGSTVQIDAGGVLKLFSQLISTVSTNHTAPSIQGLGAVELVNSGFNVSIADDATLTIDLTISTVVQGSNASSGFFTSDQGTLALSGANTFGGDVSIGSGAIVVESDTALGTTAGKTIVSGGASVFFMGAGLNVAEDFTIDGVGIASSNALGVLSGSTTLTGGLDMAGNSQIGAVDGSTLTINGVISDVGGPSQLSILQGVNTGRTVLGGTNTYRGGTTVTSGTVAITNNAALGTGTVTVGDGSANAGHLEIDLSGTRIVSNTLVFNAPIALGLDVKSGTTTFNGGSTLSENLGINVATGASLQFAGPINDGGQAKSLTKGGPGTLIFSGVNTYTGTTFVDEGLLQLNCGITCIAGNLTVSGPGTAATVQLLQGNQIADTAAVNLANAGATLDLNGFSDTIASLSMTGSTVTTGAGTLTIASGGGITSLASSITAVISGNLDLSGGTTTFTVATGSTSSGVDLSIPAVIANGTLTKAGTGRMSLSGDNTFTTNIQLSGGYLRAASDNAFGNAASSTTITSANATSIEFSGGITIPSTKSFTLSLNGFGNTEPKLLNVSGDNTVDGAITLAGNEEFEVAAGSTLTLAGAISQTGGSRFILSSGEGTLVLGGTNSYTGSTYLSAGTFLVDGSISSSSSVTMLGAATLGGSGTVPAFTLTTGGSLSPGTSTGILSSGNANFVSGSTFRVGLDGTTVGTQYDQLSVTGSVTLAGATLTLTLGYNSIPGETFTIISNDGSDAVTGTFNGLAQNSIFNVGQKRFQISYSGGDGNDVVLTSLVSIDTWSGLGGDNNWTTGANWVGGMAPNAGDQLIFPAGASRITNVNDFAAGTAFDSIEFAGAGYSINGNGVSLANGIGTTYGSGSTTLGIDLALAANQSIDVGSGGSLTVSGIVSGSYSLRKAGGGTLTLSNLGNEASFSGAMTVSAGTLAVGDDDALGSGSLTFTGGFLNVTATTTIDNSIILNVVATAFNISSGVTATLSGVVSETGGSRALNKGSSGTLVLSGTNTYTGNTNLNGGTVSVAGDANLGSGTIRFNQGGTLVVTAAGTIDNAIFLNVPATINTTDSVTLSGVIDGTSNLTKAGVGTLTLIATETYTGSTTVSAGTLFVNGTIASSSGVQVSSGAILGGFGTVSVLTALSGGTVSPGNSPGIFGSGNLSLASGSTLNIEIDGVDSGTQYDTMAVTGTVDLGGATLSLSAGYSPAPGDAFTILDNDGSDPITGTFAGLSEGATITVGGYTFQISYVGGSGNDVVLQAFPSITVLTSSVSGSPVYGQANTLTATVTGFSGNTPTGTVTFMDGATTLGTAPLDGSGVATFSVSTASVGSHSYTAIYSGDANDGPSQNLTPFEQTVVQASTTTAVSSTANPSVFGQSVTFTATVSATAPGAGIPTGTVSFFDGATLLGTGTLNGSGSATLSTSILATAGHSITAVFGGDVNFAGSTSSTYSQVVNKAATSSVLTSTINPSTYGDSIELTVTVTATAPGAGIPSGTIVFKDGAITLGSVAIEDGVATLILGGTELTGGTHSLSAIYSGDGNFLTDTSTLSQVVNKAATTSTVVSSGTPTVYGQSVTFTATVTSVPGIPTGTVNFLAGGVVIASAVPLVAGTATFATATLHGGTSQITVVYSGDGNFQTSTSSSISQVVTKAPLVVQATPKIRAYGDANPTLTASFTGFQNGQTLATSDITGSAGLTTDATPTSPVSGSPYTIFASLGSLASDDYSFTFVNSTMTVVKASVNVLADAKSRFYGDANPPLTVTYVGLKNGQTFLTSGITGAPSISTGATPLSPVGGYTISVSAGTLSSANYNFSYYGNTLTVNKAVLSVNATSLSRIYGDANPTLTANFSGFKNGQTLATSDVTGSPTLGTSASPTSSVGTYAIATGLGSLASGNYSFSLLNGVLTVTKADLTVSADNQARIYGNPNPTLTASITGFKNGQTLATSGVSGSPFLSTVAVPTSPVSGSPYAITATVGSLSSGNYNFLFTNGQLAISKAPLTVTANNQGRLYGNPNPTLTATYTGFKNGETLATSDLTGSPSLATSAVPLSPVSGSPYAIVAAVGSLASGNYSLGFANGSLAVNVATPQIGLTSSPSSSAFGQSVTFTATVGRGAVSTGTPTGMVTFKDGQTTLGTALLNGSGVATFTTSALSVANHSISYVYSGDGNFKSGSSSILNQNVAKAATTTSLGTSLTPTVFGQSVTFTATVAVNSPGAGIPTGLVAFYDGGILIGQSNVSQNGIASLTTSNLSAGSHTIAAVYAGNSAFSTSTSSSLTQTVGKAGLTGTVISSSNPRPTGLSVSFTATFTATPPAAGIPNGGSVIFYDGATPIGTTTLSNGQATLNLSTMSVGSHVIRADYAGNASFSATSTSNLTQTIGKTTATVGVLTSGSTVSGQNASFSITITPATPLAGTPTGTVQLLEGASLIGSATLVNGAAQINTSSLSVGQHSLLIRYSGDASLLTADSSPVTQTVAKANSSASIHTSNPSTSLGQSVTFTAVITSVSPGTGQPTGTVTFKDGANVIGSATLANGVATFSTSSLGTGSHSISASYAGDASFNTSVSTSLTQTVAKSSSTTALNVSVPSPVFGQSTTFTATVASASGTPTGTVTFRDGATVLATVPLSGNSAAFSTTLTTGDHAITAAYNGDAGTNVSSSAISQTVVNRASTAVAVTSTSPTAVYGQWVAYTASVTPIAPGAGTPTGTVTFRDGATVIGSAPIVSGSASLVIAMTGAGSAHSISATYEGNGNFLATTSPTINQVVNKAASQTFMTVTPTTRGGVSGYLLTVGVATTLPGGGVPTGSVVIYAQGKPYQTLSLVNGQATLFLSKATAKSLGNAFAASYGGDFGRTASTSSIITIGGGVSGTSFLRKIASFRLRGR